MNQTNTFEHAVIVMFFAHCATIAIAQTCALGQVVAVECWSGWQAARQLGIQAFNQNRVEASCIQAFNPSALRHLRKPLVTRGCGQTLDVLPEVDIVQQWLHDSLPNRVRAKMSQNSVFLYQQESTTVALLRQELIVSLGRRRNGYLYLTSSLENERMKRALGKLGVIEQPGEQ